jgi:hypothetical protein
VADLFRTLDRDFVGRLKSFYTESESVLELLRAEYDELVGAAIRFFRQRSFPDTELELSIRDHGEVGAPPYYPKMTLKGFLTCDLDPHDFRSMRPNAEPPNVEAYTGSIEISQPTIESHDAMGQSLVRGTIKLSASFVAARPAGMIGFDGAAEQLPYLRDVEIEITGATEGFKVG